MRINTDGVLLAAMAETPQPTTILDIGTGTGVIALMLAQRFKNATVHAVEIDEVASATAKKNFGNSNFACRLQLSNVSIEQFESASRFDLIVSNPPFFVNDLKNVEEKKGMARHASDQFFEVLLAKVASLLSENGSFWFILPLKQAALVIDKAKLHSLYADQEIYLHSDDHKAAFRVIVCLRRKIDILKVAHFYIYESEKVYTSAYKALLADFFIGY